jgi:DNA-binding LacI/PurR family transcriptional regulator
VREHQVTIRSVAIAARVSMSTVSNILSGRHEQLAVETRERVLSPIASLNYLPNQAARSLVTKPTVAIGLIMSDRANSRSPSSTPHLLDLGHRRIAHLAGSPDRLTGTQCRAGYLRTADRKHSKTEVRMLEMPLLICESTVLPP